MGASLIKVAVGEFTATTAAGGGSDWSVHSLSTPARRPLQCLFLGVRRSNATVCCFLAKRPHQCKVQIDSSKENHERSVKFSDDVDNQTKHKRGKKSRDFFYEKILLIHIKRPESSRLSKDKQMPYQPRYIFFCGKSATVYNRYKHGYNIQKAAYAMCIW
jgi:hypothetical protein